MSKERIKEMTRIAIILIPVLFLALVLHAGCAGLESAYYVPDMPGYDAEEDQDDLPARATLGMEWDLLSCAVEKAGAVPDPNERVGVLLEIAADCNEKLVGGMCDAILAEAEETAAAISGLRDRQIALLKVAMARADGGAYDEALALCGKLEIEDFKAIGLTHAAVRAGQAGRHELADEILSSAVSVGLGMPFDAARERVLLIVAQDLAEAGRTEEALAVSGMMKTGDMRNSAMEGVALALIEAEEWKRADKVIARVKDANRVCDLLDAMAGRLIAKGRHAAAVAVLEKLVKAAARLESPESGLTWRTRAAMGYVGLGNRDKALEFLLHARTAADEIDDTRAAVSLLTDISEGSLFRDMLLSDVAAGHAAIGDFASALHLVETMGDEEVINGSLADLSMRYAKTGLYDDALMTITSLADPGERSAALVVIAMRLIGEGRLGKALEAIRRMSGGIEKADALLEAAKACLEAGEVSRMRSALAEAALEALRISDPAARRDVLAGIVLTSFEGGAADLGLEVLAKSGPGVKAVVLGRLATGGGASKDLIPSVMTRLHCD